MEPEEIWIERGLRNLAESGEHVARALGGGIVRWDEAWASDPGSACPFLNNVVLRGPLTDESAAALCARLATFYGGRGGGSWLLWSGWPTPDLAPQGYTFWGEPPLMVRRVGGAAPTLPDGLRIERVRSASALSAFEQVLVEGFPVTWVQPFRPGCLYDTRVLGERLHLLVGFVDGQPVSCAAAYVGDDAVGVYCVATLPAARGHGYGSAVTWAATLAAPQLPALLQASDLGRPIYERMGYQMVRRLSLWEVGSPGTELEFAL